MYTVLTIVEKTEDSYKKLATMSHVADGNFNQVAIVEHCLADIEMLDSVITYEQDVDVYLVEFPLGKQEYYKVIDNASFAIRDSHDLDEIMMEYIRLVRSGEVDDRLDDADFALEFIEKIVDAFGSNQGGDIEVHSTLMESIND